MRRILLCFMLLCMLIPSAYAQDEGLERDSLPVFVIQDEELASFVDDFIVEAQNFESDTHTEYRMYVDLYNSDGTGVMFFELKLIRQDEGSDSWILYKNPNYNQAFIRHRDVLFQTNIRSHSVSFNHYLLTGMLKVLPMRQAVCFKDPPPDPYYFGRPEGQSSEYIAKSSIYEYFGTEWSQGFIKHDNYEEFEIIDNE